jgi:hypothetical protein
MDCHADPCRSGCSGHGSRSNCPPLIIIATLMQDATSEQLLEQSRNPEAMEPGKAKLPMAPSFKHLALQVFCPHLSFPLPPSQDPIPGYSQW